MISYHKKDEDDHCKCSDKDNDRDKNKKDEKSEQCKNEKEQKEQKEQKDHKEKKDHKDHHKSKHTHHKICVKEVLTAIHAAQKKVRKEEDCQSSCDRSIKELFEDCKKPKKNTIPFILFCEDCEPFKATGVKTYCHSKQKKFVCITSFIFRIKELEGKCAVLELLEFKPSKHHSDSHKKKICSPCSQIDGENVNDLINTGVCINVDLSCFCAVTCLPAVHLKDECI